MEKLETVTPMEVGINPEVIDDFLNRIQEKKAHLHSFIMIKGDKVFARGAYAPCKESDMHTLFSLSKSFTSTAVGFAVQEGRLSLEDRVVDFFAEELESVPPEAVCENMKKMTLHHLLTMNTGHTDPDDGLFHDRTRDWCVSFLTSYVEREPGSWFLYNTRATYMLAVILQKVTGERLFDYLKKRLFEPLGFSEKIWWELSPQGYNAGGFGLNISVEDIAKFGLFVKNKGRVGERRLLNEQWFDEAVKPWSDSSNTWTGESKYGYGYQFWRCHVPGAFRGDGAFGQYCVILPVEDMIFATTAGELDMQRILDAYWESVYAYVTETDETEQNRSGWNESWEKVQNRIEGLTLSTYYEDGNTRGDCIQIPAYVLDREYKVSENGLQITSLKFTEPENSEAGECVLELGNGEKCDSIRISAGKWTYNRLHIDERFTETGTVAFRSGLFDPLYVKGCTVDGVLYLDMFFPETAFQDTWKIVFREEGLQVSVKRNACFVPGEFTMEGK